MDRTALRSTVRSPLTWVMALYTAGMVALALTSTAPIDVFWACVGASGAAGVIALFYSRRADLHRSTTQREECDADRARQQHTHDVEMERLAQEADIVAGGGPAADQILARWDAERKARQTREREARQERIASYEAGRLDA